MGPLALKDVIHVQGRLSPLKSCTKESFEIFRLQRHKFVHKSSVRAKSVPHQMKPPSPLAS